MTDTTTGTPTPARPKYYDDAVREIAVDGIIEEVSEWLQESSQFQQKALKEVLVRCMDVNAYAYAHNLEQRHGWSPDARLVEILDQLSLYRAHEQVVAAWVEQHAIVIPLSVGDRISAPTIKAGTVKELLPKSAQISIATGEHKKQHSTLDIRVVIDFEDAIPLLGTIGDAPAAANTDG